MGLKPRYLFVDLHCWSVGFRKELPKLRLVQRDANWDAGWSLARMLRYVSKRRILVVSEFACRLIRAREGKLGQNIRSHKSMR